MKLTIASWNINSVRLRAALVVRFLREESPDILCLQECKSPVEKIPAELFAEAGYGHMVARGEKGYNGVAILSRVPIEDAGIEAQLMPGVLANIKSCTEQWCRISGEGFDGYIDKTQVWGVYPDEPVD